MINESGHILIYGETNSGKTNLTIKLCHFFNPTKIFIYTSISKCYKDVFNNSEIFENFDNIKYIKNYIIDNTTENTNFIIVFDDFNYMINTQTNSEYIELFTKYRHYNTRIINLVHSVKAVGRTIRLNCQYIYISASINNNETIKDLGIQYYNSNYRDLEKNLKDARNDNIYNFIFIDRRNNKFEIINANDIKINDINVITTLPEKSSILSDPENSNCLSTTPIQNNVQLNFQKKANKDFVDNSNNKITYNNTISSNQLIQTKKDQYEIKIMSLHMEHSYKIEEKKEHLKNNLLNPNRSELDIINIIKDLKFFAKVPIDVDRQNYLDYGMLYLKKNHNIDVQLFENNKTHIENAIDVYRGVSSFSSTNTSNIVNYSPLDIFSSFLSKFLS